jgi:HEAT repeat protein
MIKIPSATLVAMLAASASQVCAQSLADRVKAAPDGRVQFTFAARAGICGNGRSYIQTGPNSYSGTFNGKMNDAMRADPCMPGPVRVVIDRAEKIPISVQAYVGPPDAPAGVTDLGAVRAQDAADYLLSLASTVDGRAGRDGIFPALLADSANTASTLVAIGRNQALPRETRRTALSWMGRSTDGMATIPATVTAPLLAIARDESDNQSVRQQSLSVLGRLDHGAGVLSLIDLSKQTQSVWLAKESMSALARSGDPRARQYLRTAVRRTDLPEEVQAVAVRALGQDYATAQDAALLREIYPKLQSDRSRSAAFQALTEIGGGENSRWLLDMAKNENETLATRRKAVDAASRSGVPIGELVKLYDTTTDPQMKDVLVDHYIRSNEPAAIDKLLAIVKSEQNASTRKRAISRLSRSDNPKIRQALLEIVVR